MQQDNCAGHLAYVRVVSDGYSVLVVADIPQTRLVHKDELDRLHAHVRVAIEAWLNGRDQ